MTLSAMLKTNALALVFWLGSAFATLKPAPRADRTLQGQRLEGV